MEILEKLPDNIKEHIKKGGKDILDGYIRFLDENSIEEIKAILEKSPMWEGGIPFATTVFADVFVWNREYILLYKFTEADYNVILSGSKFFFANVDDIEYQKDFLMWIYMLWRLESLAGLPVQNVIQLNPFQHLAGQGNYLLLILVI